MGWGGGVRSVLRIDTPATVDLSLILRGVFASSVVFWHVVGWRLDGHIWAGLNLPGRASVWMFFGLSGYVIGHGFFSGRYALDLAGINNFYLRRAVRILPLFWLISLLALGASLLGVIAFDWTPGTLAAALFMLQWSHVTYPVGVFWTLGIEMQFYLVAPFLCWALVKAGRFWVVAGFGVLVLLLILFGEQPDLRTLPGVIMFFLAGLLMARWAVAAPEVMKSWTVWTNMALGCVALMVVSDAYPARFWNHVGPVFVVVALMLFLRAHVAMERRAVPAGRVTRGLMVVGTLAYGLYAWHGLLLVVWMPFQENLALTYGTSLLLAWLSFVLFERPVRRRVERRHAEGAAG